MNFNTLNIKNFLTVGEAEVQLNERGLLLIQGKNMDDPSAESNGAGKSSVVDALCWALFGETARGVTGDAVVNKTAKKDCSVFVFIEDGVDRYKIERFRKHATQKNQLLVWRLDPAGGPSIPMSKGTDKETQEVVDSLIGCSLQVFMSAVYAGQEMMPDLPGMTDKMLKTLIEEAAGVEVLTEAYTVARTRYQAAKGALDTVVVDLANVENAKTRMTAELADMTAKSADFEAGRKERAKVELAKILPVKASIAAAVAEMAAADEPAINKELGELAARLSAHRSEQEQMDRLTAAAAGAAREVTRVKTQLEMMAADIKRAEAAVASVESQVGKPCGECGKHYHEEDLAVAKKAREDQVVTLREKAKPVAKALSVAQDAAKTALDDANAFRAALTDVSAVAARQRDLTAQIRTLDSKRTAITTMGHEVVRHNDAARVKLNETNPWTKALENKTADLKRNDALLITMQATVEAARSKAELLADAVKVFGPAGVRAHILDTVTPYLNDRTQEYLGALADGNIHATWSTLSKTAKGELKEKFNIEVFNDKGAESFAGLSGGEKRKVRLATSMALQDMVASRATKPVNLFIADEVDHALDESGLERLMGVLERKARERGTVLVISHNSLSDWIDDVITVTKSGGVATLAGATHGV